MAQDHLVEDHRDAARAAHVCGALPIFAASLLFAALSPVGGLAQGVDCTKLQAQITAIDQTESRTNPYAGAVQKQRAEIERTRAYAESIGCGNRQFLFFGSAPPPQCGGLNARVQEMRTNLATLEANSARSGGNAQRQELVMRYNAYCRPEQPQQPRGFLESLFGGPQREAPPPTDVQPGDPIISDQDQKAHGGSEALCVRTCDGGFFPMIYSSHHPADSLTELCHASCPGADVSVYTRVPGQEVQTAVGLDGTAYMDLPTALKYQKSFDPQCTCHPPGKSWAEALAGAERILGHERKGDIIVTPEKSAEMARPKVDPRKPQPATTKAQPTKPATTTDQDDIESRDAAAAAQVPTANKDSAGIASGEVKSGTAYPEGQGQTVEVVGPDGVKRRVRIVGPAL